MSTKQFYKSFFSLFALLVLQNVVTLAVNLADNIMIGGYSEIALSGVAAVNQVQFVYQQLLMGLGDTLVIFGSRFWGEGDLFHIKKVSAIGMRVALTIGVVVFVATGLFPRGVLSLFTSDGPIIEEGMSYLAIVRYSYFFFAITQLLLATLRCVETVQIAFILSIVAFCTNCGINYVLIYGRFGAPCMGAAGAAVGTLIARIVEFIVLLFFVKVREKKLHLHVKDFFLRDRVLTRDVLRLAIPSMFISGMWGLNIAMQTVILGHMDASAIAANSISSTLFMVLKAAAMGAAAASAIMVGKCIGEGNLAETKKIAQRLQRVFVCIGLFTGCILLLLREPILRLYNVSAETKEMAGVFILIQTVALIFMSYQMPTNCGIIKAGGSVSYVVKLDLISIWCIVIPISLIMAFWVEASPIVVVCCLNADQVFKGIPAFITVNRRQWIKKITTE